MVGGGEERESNLVAAEEVGRLLATAGAYLLCGGLGGVMERASRGAHGAGGMTIGILPGEARNDANAFLDVALPTGLGEARNTVIVSCADALIAIGGEFGTLSEIALALRAGKPVVGLETWELAKGGTPDDSIARAGDPADAVARALALAGR